MKEGKYQARVVRCDHFTLDGPEVCDGCTYYDRCIVRQPESPKDTSNTEGEVIK